MAVTQEPILSRLDRLDNLMRHLEEMRRGFNRSTKSSSPSTPSSGTRASDGHASSFDYFSPRSRDKLHCRPIDDVIVETEHKGTLLDRVSLMEDRLLKLEEEMKAENQGMIMKQEDKSQYKKKGLKQFVKSCVQGSRGKDKKKFHQT